MGGHELPGSVIVVEPERQPLVVVEELGPHVAFHLRAHHVASIVDEQRTQRVNGHEGEHHDAHYVDVVDRPGHLRREHVLRDVSRAQRQDQRNGRQDEGA